jgi:hypothetical protein
MNPVTERSMHVCCCAEYSNPENRFICKTGTEQHTTGPADFLKISGENQIGAYGHKIEINSVGVGVKRRLPRSTNRDWAALACILILNQTGPGDGVVM